MGRVLQAEGSAWEQQESVAVGDEGEGAVAGATGAGGTAEVWAPRGGRTRLCTELRLRVPPVPCSSGGLGQCGVPAAARGSRLGLSHPQNLAQPTLDPSQAGQQAPSSTHSSQEMGSMPPLCSH